VEGKTDMAAKRNMKLPREANVGPEEAAARKLIDNGDVEGHGLPTTAPPSLSRRGGGAGGEIVARKLINRKNDGDDSDDVEGYAKH
jgi:hypothetical protein